MKRSKKPTPVRWDRWGAIYGSALYEDQQILQQEILRNLRIVERQAQRAAANP
jgi:hypothetical protein